MRKNILFFILAIALSLATAPYFGSWYDKFFPQQGEWIIGRNDSIFFAGFILSYIFFMPFFLWLFGEENRSKSIFWFLMPVVVFLLYANIREIYIPIIFGFVGFVLAFVVRKIFFKRYSTPLN